MTMLRDTEYAREIVSVSCKDEDGVHESRLERLHIKEKDVEEIRLSWWKDGRMQIRPLDLPENELALLLSKAIAAGALSGTFLIRVQENIAAQMRT